MGASVEAAHALFNRALRHRDLHQRDQEIAVYAELINGFGGDPDPVVRQLVAKAIFNKGVALGRQSRHGSFARPVEEVAAYDELINRFGEDSAPEVRLLAATALLRKGRTLVMLRQLDKLIATVDDLVSR